MYLEKYPYSYTESFLNYEFLSNGPKGVVKKRVRFTQLDRNLYNLAFGDYDEKTRYINDIVVTNNNDRLKILATVAEIVYDFIISFPGVEIFAKGSTHSRTRLYRMGITKYWDLISSKVMIYGYSKGRWVEFERNNEYSAFLIHQK